MTRAALTVITAASLLAACSKNVVVKPKPVNDPNVVTLNIPPGHLPKPGMCRVWFPGMPPAKQGMPGDCASLAKRVPLGAWLVYRPSANKKEVRVWMYDDRTPRLVVAVRTFDYTSRKLIREEKPGNEKKAGKKEKAGKSR